MSDELAISIAFGVGVFMVVFLAIWASDLWYKVEGDDDVENVRRGG